MEKLFNYYYNNIFFLICVFFISLTIDITNRLFYLSVILFVFVCYCFFNIKIFHRDYFKNRLVNFNYFLFVFVIFDLFVANGLHFKNYFCIFTIINLVSLFVNYFIKSGKCSVFFLKLEKICININENEKKLISKEFFFGLMFVIISLFCLEKYSNYLFFLQDDNFHQFFPVICQSCRDFFEKGLFPEINPYQMGGMPTLSTGLYALTYPFTYISFAISKYLFKNEIYTMEIFAVIHILIAYVLSYIAGRMCKIKPVFSSLYSICYCLSGWSLFILRSWYFMIGITAFAPLIIIMIQHLRNLEKGFNFKHIFLYGILTGLLAHAGNIQMWGYFTGFYILSCFILFILKEIYLKKLISAFFVVLTGVCFASPILYLTGVLFKDIERAVYTGLNLFPYVLSVIIPDYILKHFRNSLFGQAFYSGTVGMTFTILLFAAIIIALTTKNNISVKQIFKDNIFLFIGIFALILSFGESFYLWDWLHSFGNLKYLRQPVKMVVFVNLFLLLSGFLTASRIVKTKISKTIMVIFVVVLMCIHMFYVKSQSMCTYKTNIYHKISPVITEDMDIKNYRVLPIVPFRSELYDYSSLTLGLNFSSIYKISSINAYSNNFEDCLKKNIDLNIINSLILNKIYYIEFPYIQEYLKNYGVKYIFLYEENNFKFKDSILKKHFKKIHQFDKIHIYEIPYAKPLAFVENFNAPIPIELNSQGFILDTKNIKPGVNLTINMICHSNYKLYNQNKNEIKWNCDKLNRIKLKLPDNTSSITGRYHSGIEIMKFFQ